MMRGERMKHSQESVVSEELAASSSPIMLSFEVVGDGDSSCREKSSLSSASEKDLQGLPGKTTAVNAKEVVSTRKRGASAGSSVSEASSEKVPSSCGSKKRTLPPTAHGTQGSIKAHHHRRSPSLHIENVATITEYSTSAPCPARTLRQSASFSGGILSTARPGGRPLPSADVQINPTPRGGTSKTARHGSSRRLTSAQHGEAQRSNTEVEEDATFCHDHNVQVFIRARPVNSAEIAQQGEIARCIRQENAHTVSWLGQPETRFTFDHVAGEFVTQGELFRLAGLPMVDNCMAGYNSCMFAYGQTGSGKTHTMLGDIGDFENRGMTPRVFEYLFAKICKEEEAQKQGKLKYKCRCSFLEIYNEQISDLLEPSSTNLQMREDVKKGVFVEGLLEVEVQTVQDVLHLLLLGATNRKVAATNMNRESSRSHSVFTCVIESQWECDSMINFRFGRLNLVDLAGSERQKDTGADEERLREAASINKSLSTLGLVIMVLVDIANGKQRHVPYRDSKLTFLLQDSLGGNSKTTIIANISPSICASSETLSTLKFAQRAKFIQNNAVINEEASGDVKGLQEQIQLLKDELARNRRQSVSRMPSKSLSERKGGLSTDENTGDAKDSFDPLSPTQGSFLQFGRAVPSPKVSNHKVKAMEALLVGDLRREKLLVKTSAAEIEHLALLVKQREDETYFQKSTLPQSREQEIRSETCDAEESSSVPLELGLPLMPDQCNNLDHMRLSVENIHLQERLRRCQEYDAFQERETMVQDISNLRKKLQLLDMLDRNISMDAAAGLPQQEVLVAELATERQVAEHLRNEVESFQRDLSECRMKLQTSLESNERIARELDAFRWELESSKDECRKHKQDLATLQLKKALEVNCLELMQAQHQHVVLELKTQLQESEEKAEQETIRRNQIEQRLQEALQESTNLQTELQWTTDSLEGTEAFVETFQRSEPVLEIGDPEASYEAFMVGQLQVEIIEMHARLEDERRHRRELEDVIKANNGNVQEFAYELTNNCPKHDMSTEKPCNAKRKRKVKHQEAILQLQMELDSIESGATDAVKGYRWEEGPVVIDMDLQLDMETGEGVLAGERQNLADAKASRDRLRQHLKDLSQSKLNAEKALNLSDSLADLKGNGELITTEAQVQEVDKITGESMAKKQTVIAREHTLVAAVAEAEQRYIVAEAARLNLEEQLRKHLEAAHDLQHQIEMKEEEIVKLKEQAETKQVDWVVENSGLQVALRELEERCVENNQTITNLEKMLASLKNSENETVAVQLGERLGTNSTTESAVDNLMNKEKSQLLRTDTTEDACSEDNWKNFAKDFATSKIVVLQSRCEGYPSGKAKVELARTQVLLTGSEGKVKLLSEMVAKIRKNRSEDHSDVGSFNEKLENLNLVPKEEQECINILKTMVFTLDAENADLQHQLLQTEADSTALKSTLANLQRELQDSSHQRSEEVAALVSQLHVSDRHIFKLECQSVELQDAMQRQAVAFGALYEQLYKQESLQMLEEEKAELMACRKKAEKYRAKSRQLELQVKALQEEIERMQPLRKEIVLIYEELHNSRSSTEMAAQETDRLRSLVEDMERSRGQLQEEVKRKQCAIEALEEHLLKSEQSKLQCQEELHLCEQMAEVNTARAQEKQVEVEILGKSVEELENTVYAMESQVGLLKRERERQRLARENIERELQGLNQQNVNLRAALTEKISTTGDGLRREFNAERKLEEREAEIQLLRKKLEKHQMGSEEKISFPQPTNIQKGKKKPKGSIGSAFRWFKMNHQVHSELDEERKSYERRIQELEDVLGNRQHEVAVLKEKLADAERVTRDVLCVLHGVKVDMANVATLVEKQQVEDAHVKSDKRKLLKDEEVERILTQLNNFIEERESWLEIISRKQAELTATQAAMEKLREREKALVAENKKFKNENRMQVKKIGQLEQEMKTLSGQQTKHLVKIKDENNALRIQNNDLSAKLRRVEHVNTRVSDELAKYRIAQGRQPLLNIEEEQRLRTKLQEAQEQSGQLAQTLACFSARVMKAAGMPDCNSNNTDSPSVALEAVEQMKACLESTQLELDDVKLKIRIVGERRRLSQMRTPLSPMRGINTQSVTPR